MTQPLSLCHHSSWGVTCRVQGSRFTHHPHSMQGKPGLRTGQRKFFSWALPREEGWEWERVSMASSWVRVTESILAP